MPKELLRHLPQVDKLLGLPAIEGTRPDVSRSLKADALRIVLDRLRHGVLRDEIEETALREALADTALSEALASELTRMERSGYRRVVNATGIILHTGLGRAVLPPAALQAIRDNLGGYSLVEVDPHSGERNHREEAVVRLLLGLTGAEAGTVVNNNAAATLLILAALARGREVIISRGQLVEIGGSFRIPDILRESGARLVEVGTTNRTYLRDYAAAITPETGLLLQVHTSNYAIRGFHHETSLEELVALGAEHGVPVASDLGSGCFVDVSAYGFDPEPLVADRVSAGADLVCVSGDKLLGGPQAGIIVGKSEAVARVRRHPLYRTVRVDKLILTALEATLRPYRERANLAEHVPVVGMIREPATEVRQRAERVLTSLRAAGLPCDSEVVASTAQAGSGALPAQEIPSFALSLNPPPGLPPLELARSLREGEPPVFSRVQDDRVLLDLRTVLEPDVPALVAAVTAALPSP